MEFRGEFETHLTVANGQSWRIAELQRWALKRGLKCLHIVLDRGMAPSQPMLSRRGQGILSGELRIADELVEQLNREGFQIVRVKIEAGPENHNIPLDAEMARKQSSDQYFEHHIKLLLDPAADQNELAKIVVNYEAHLSRNALKIRPDGFQERFVTQRCKRVGQDVARKSLGALLKSLSPLAFEVLRVEEEYVVSDSNIELDAGWLPGIQQ